MKLYARKSIIALSTVAALSLSMVTAPVMAAEDPAPSSAGESSQSQSTSESSAKAPAAGGEEGTGSAAKPDSPEKKKTPTPAPAAASPNGTTTSTESPTTSTTPAAGTQKAGSQNTDSSDKQEKKGDAKYRQLFVEVKTGLDNIEKRIDTLRDAIKARKAELKKTSDPAAQQKLDSAEASLQKADGKLGTAQAQLHGIEAYGDSDSPDYGTLKGLQDSIRQINSDLSDAESDYRASAPVKCEDSTNANSDSGSGGSFGSLFDSFGSSGRMSLIKDGKKTCVSKAEYYSEKLTKIVAILGTVFTLITTMTKISETIQKQALPRS